VEDSHALSMACKRTLTSLLYLLYAYRFAGIVEDSHALSMACKRTLTSLLYLLYAYREETDYSVLSHTTTVCKSCMSD